MPYLFKELLKITTMSTLSDERVIKTMPVKNATIEKIRGDGHCLINSVLQGMKFVNSLAVPSSSGLLEMIKYEILSNMDFYMVNMTENMDVVSQLNDYIIDRKYGSDIVDLVLLAISNVLQLTVNVFVKRDQNYVLLNLLQIIPGRTTAQKTINILRSGDHFDAIRFLTSTNGQASETEVNMSQSFKKEDEESWITVKKKQRFGYGKPRRKHSPIHAEIITITDSDSDEDNIFDINPFAPLRDIKKEESYVIKESSSATKTKIIDLISDSDDDKTSNEEMDGYEQAYSPAILTLDSENDSSNSFITESTVQQKKVPRVIWNDVPLLNVATVPNAIDGLVKYRIEGQNRNDLQHKCRDGRKWKHDSRTNWAGFKSVRYRDCAGGYSCPNIFCPYFIEFGKVNNIEFDKDQLCKYCCASGIINECRARKYTAFTNVDSEVYIYHCGKHTCEARDMLQRPTFEVSSAISKDVSVKPAQIQSNNIIAALRCKEPWETVTKTVRKVSSVKKISNEKIKQKQKLNPHGESFEAVNELKDYTDKKDRFLISSIDQNRQCVFKTSTVKMKMAENMSKEQHFLSDEYCHFDGNHKRVKSFVTLTASVYHPLLKKQVFLATMQCKHENELNVETFWRLFNEAYKGCNKTNARFSPQGWCSDMATANFNGLIKIYGEDVLDKVKGCEFHYKQSVDRKAKSLGDKSEKFKELAYNLLEATTPEAYSNALQHMESFLDLFDISSLRDWLKWWNSRKELIFRAFTNINAPRSNLSEVIHAGWKNKDRTGVTLLESCFFYIRDSLLTEDHLASLEKGNYDGGNGPSTKTRKLRQEQRNIDTAAQIGRDITDFGVNSSIHSGKRCLENDENDNGCNPPKRRKTNEKLSLNRLNAAKQLEHTIKVKTVTTMNSLNKKFNLNSSACGRTTYTVQVCNTPTCTCPDFQKNGVRVHCKHLFFVLLFILKVNETDEQLKMKYISDEDLRALLQHDVEKKYMQAKQSTRTTSHKEILKSHPSFNNQQISHLHHKTSRSAKCHGKGCRAAFPIGNLCIKIVGALTVPYGKKEAIEQMFYFCPRDVCIRGAPIWCNVRYPSQIIIDTNVTNDERNSCTELSISTVAGTS